MSDASKTVQLPDARAPFTVPTSTTDLEEVGSAAGGSSGNGEAEALSPDSEGGAYPTTFGAQKKRTPHADVSTASKSPKYVNLDFVATPFVETLDAMPQKLPVSSLETRSPLELHERRECKPCAWFWTPQGCQKRETCEFCHLCPEGELKVRRKQRLQVLRALKKVGAPPGLEEVGGLGASPTSLEDSSNESARADRGLGELPSIGSANHGLDCRPCAWFWKSEGCKNGKDCRHCHLCPEGEIRRKKKMKQEDIKHALASQRAELQLQEQLMQMQMLQQMQASMMIATMNQMPDAAFRPWY